jgi:hypothetical protein
MKLTGYILKTHAITRFKDRVRPGLGWSAAEREFERLLRMGTAVEQPPAWLIADATQGTPRYVLIGDDIVVPLVASVERPGDWVALTCIARGGLTEQARTRRNERRSQRTAARRSGRDTSTHGRRDHRRDRRLWNTKERFEHAA